MIEKVAGPLYRKDGRQLVTDHPLSWEDEIDYLPREVEKELRGTECRKSAGRGGDPE